MKRLLIVTICAAITFAASARPAAASEGISCNWSQWHVIYGGDIGHICSQLGDDGACNQLASSPYVGCAFGYAYRGVNDPACADVGSGGWADCTFGSN
jgi:hypothetical protein